jgi:hypothetical protein
VLDGDAAEFCLAGGSIVDRRRSELNLECVVIFNDSYSAGPRELRSRLLHTLNLSEFLFLVFVD